MRIISTKNTTRLSTARGFTLIELLIVATIIGLIVAIAIPNLLHSIQRARQTRTMADVNAIGKGLSMYHQDEILFPIAAKDTDAEAIRQHIAQYISSFNPTDGWKNPFLYTSTNGRHYTLISYGMDSAASEPYTPGPTMFFDDDLVMVDGMFLQYPDGPQQ